VAARALVGIRDWAILLTRKSECQQGSSECRGRARSPLLRCAAIPRRSATLGAEPRCRARSATLGAERALQALEDEHCCSPLSGALSVDGLRRTVPAVQEEEEDGHTHTYTHALVRRATSEQHVTAAHLPRMCLATYCHYCYCCYHSYIHTYIHTYMHTCIHAYMHTCIHACIHT